MRERNKIIDGREYLSISVIREFLYIIKESLTMLVIVSISLILINPSDAYTFSLTDTSQESCYSGTTGVILDLDLNAVPCWSIPAVSFQGTYGQDGHYTQGTKPIYEDNLDGTVTDQSTGLTWQSTDCTIRTWYESMDYCDNLEFANYDDWRLPSRHELTTILDPSRWRPVLNTDYFDHCIPADTSFYYYFSSTTTPEDSSKAYVVEFQHGGPLGSDGVERYKLGGSPTRCVRGENLPVSQFVDNQNETVTDTSTGLMWQKGSQPIKTRWDENLQYCGTLELAGYGDWRLPNIRELESLVDDSRYNPSINPIFGFTSEKPSSTTIAIDPERDIVAAVFSLSFRNGGIIDSSKRNVLSARCVRLGPPSDFWSKSEIEGATDYLSGLHFISPKVGWAVGSEEQVFKTTDGGITWTKLHDGGSFYYSDVHFVDSNQGWVTSNTYGQYGRGYLFHTDDGGVTWSEQREESTGGYYEDIFFIGEATGWLLMSNRLYKTEDGGTTWIDLSNEVSNELIGSYNNYRKIFFLDVKNGWIFGKVIIKTEDGGLTWVKQYEDQDKPLYSGFFSDQSHGWAVGWEGIIMKTENGGLNWAPQNSGTDGSLNFVEFSDNNNGFIFGKYGIFLHTTDGGSTWQRQYAGPPPLSVTSLQLIRGVIGYALVDGRLLKLEPNILPLAKGDLNRDGEIDLTDIITGLRLICGFYPNVTSEADVNGDAKIGVEEAIYILQKISKFE